MIEKLRDMKAFFAGDLLASVVVFLVALPLCMGIAIASGVPPALGLITGIVGGIVVGLLAGSPLQVSGPAAGLAVIVWDLVQRFGLEALGVIVLVAGALQLTAGLLKGGRIFQAVPPSVIYGMLGGIGVLIFAGQFHVMVDDKPKGSGIANLSTLPDAIWKGIMPIDGSVHHMAAAIGLLTILTLVLWNNLAPKKLKTVPGALVSVVVASLTANLLGLPIGYVVVPDDLVGEANFPTSNFFSLLLNPSLLGAALALAIVASAETLLCANATDKMHNGTRTNYDKELAAQGVGNIICGIFGALPMTGVIVRSTANVQAGAKTRTSAVMHGVWLLALVVAAPFILRLIPVSALAAILVFTGYKLVNQGAYQSLKKQGRAEVVVYLATIFGIVFTDLLTGVIFGLVLATAKLLYRLSHMTITTKVEGQKITMSLSGSATFLRLPELNAALAGLPQGQELHIDLAELDYVDHACLEAIADAEKQYNARGGRFFLDWQSLQFRSKPIKAAAVQKIAA